MARIKIWVQSKCCIWVMMGLLFCFMLLLNCLTPLIADDYVYRISFQTGELNQSVTDVLRSMYTHCFTMNGRVVSHGLESLFLLLPKLVFNLVNAAVYVGLMYVLYRICNIGKKAQPWLFAVISMAFWYFMPVFGQVALWQVGALNYLWGLAVGIVLLLPYLACYARGRDLLPKVWMKVLFCLAALPIGMYTEVTSFVAILLSLVLLVAAAISGRIKWKSWMWLPLVIACVGFLIMMRMPAEMNAKQGEEGLDQLLRGFDAAAGMLETHLKWFCVLWGGCFGLSLYRKLPQEKLVLSGVFAFGAVVANFMLTVASYYPERCLCTSCMLLILACGILLPEWNRAGMGALRALMGTALTVAFLFSLSRGAYDIWWTHTSFTARELVIAQAVEEGQEDLVLQIVHPHTKYSAFWGTKDLDVETTDTWPNRQMARYYDVNSILGE